LRLVVESHVKQNLDPTRNPSPTIMIILFGITM
jgi:hypothetical protein